MPDFPPTAALPFAIDRPSKSWLDTKVKIFRYYFGILTGHEPPLVDYLVAGLGKHARVGPGRSTLLGK